MPTLQDFPTLSEIQKYVAELEEERGFAGEDVLQKCLLLGEEVGELLKAIRKTQKISLDPNSKVGTIADEMADVLVILSAIANRCGVDLEEAFRAKEEINKKRKWNVDVSPKS